MKYLFFLIAIYFIGSCKPSWEVLLPPGTIKLNDSLFIDKYPISNFSYLEFLNNISSYWSPKTSDSLNTLHPYGLTGRNFVIEGTYVKSRIGTDKNNRQPIYDVFKPPFYGSPDSNFIMQMTIMDTIIYGILNTELYLTHPAYRSYPMVFVSKVQAEEFCKWRTDLVKIGRAVTIKDSLEYKKSMLT